MYTLSRTLAMTETVSRGAAIVGEFGCRQKLLRVCEQTVSMQYSVPDGEVSHSLRVLGYGNCELDSNCLCVCCDDVLSDDVTMDHDCKI